MKNGSALPAKRMNIRDIVVCLFCTAVLFFVHKTPPAGLSPSGFKMLGTAVIATVLWSTEIIPLPVTGIVIIFLQVVLNISSVSESLAYLASPISALLFAGFCLAAGLKKYNLYKRISVGIIKHAGKNVKKLLFFVMCAVAFLSMWMSNTATAAVMIPIVAAILKMADGHHKNLGKIFMIGIAYAATIGGIATPVGTTPNPIAIGFLEQLVDIHLNFLDWVIIGLPFVIILIPLAWIILIKLFPPEIKELKIAEFTDYLNMDDDGDRAGRKKVVFYFLLLIIL